MSPTQSTAKRQAGIIVATAITAGADPPPRESISLNFTKIGFSRP